MEAGRQDLIGSGCDALIPVQPPRAALQARMARASRELDEGKYVHTIDKAGSGKILTAGYRSNSKTARRRPRH